MAMQNAELARRITQGNAPWVIDARSSFEFKGGHIPQAVHAPVLRILLKRARLPKDGTSELVITCEHGPRAMIAKTLLALYGYRNATLLEGHMLGWRRAGLPLEKEDRTWNE
jgi:rhodanese-related sulfurtransferase